jgi:hypothetical protein
MLGGLGDFVELADHPAFAATNYSIALWFRATRRTSGSDGVAVAESLVSKGPSNWDVQLGTTADVSGGIRFQPTAGVVSASPGASYETNRWQHLVVVNEGSGNGVAIYVDGVALPLSVSGVPSPIFATTNGLRFGLRFDGTQPFVGRIDDIRVYNRALSAAEVKAITSLEAAAPSIWGQPRDIRAVEGSRAVASVEVFGERPMGFTWIQAGMGTVGTQDSLVFAPLSRLDAGIYKVVVTNALGTSTSQPFRVDVLYRPEFVIEPTDKSVEAGGMLRLIAGVDSNPEASLQWWKDGSPLDGATNATLALAAVRSTDAGRYRLVASNQVGSVMGRDVVVSVLHAPEIRRQPSSVTVDEGGTFELSIEVSALPTPKFQWFREGQPLTGATNATYRVGAATVADQGLYKVEVANSLGKVQSLSASVTVRRSVPVVSGLPTQWEVVEGGDVRWEATVTAVPAPSLQWLYEGEPLPGETNPVLRIVQVREVESGRYSLALTNTAGVTVHDLDLTVRPSGPSLRQALDTGSDLVWPLPAIRGWHYQTDISHDGQDSAQSARIGGYQSSEMRLPLRGPGSLRFWWRVSCEDGWDYAEVLLDGERKGRITGIRDWAAVRVDVPNGWHTVLWRYSKDGSTDAGADAAWVDEVQWTPDTTTRQPTWVEVSPLSDGGLQVRAIGTGVGWTAIQTSSDLETWSDLVTATLRNGVVRGRVEGTHEARFFRARTASGN